MTANIVCLLLTRFGTQLHLIVLKQSIVQGREFLESPSSSCIRTYYCGGPQLPTKDTTIKGGIRGKGELYPVNAFQTF